MKPMLLARPIVAGLCAALAVAVPTGGSWAGEPPAREPNIMELIAQLGSESFETREAATRRLMERDEAAAALREALTSRDPEVARRAKDILDALARREKERAFAAFAGALRPGAIDRAVERFVRREKWHDEPACWRAFAGLADKLTDLERQVYGSASVPTRYWSVYPMTLPGYAHDLGPKVVGARPGSPAVWEHRLVLRAEEIGEARMIEKALLVISGDVKARYLSKSDIFAGGAINVEQGITQALIVCDGDLISRGIVSDSLIIARGNVRCDGIVKNSRIISGGKVEFQHPEKVSDSKAVEKEAKPLGFVTFFDPADVGLKVESADGGVRVKGAEKAKPFAAAGLRAGDVVTALDGDAVKDADSFRRLLRAKLAVEGTTIFKVRRGDKALDIPVAHKD